MAQITKLLNGITATAIGSSVLLPSSSFTVQAVVTGSGALTATVVLEVSNDGLNFLTLATYTLSGTSTAHDGAAFTSPWMYARARLTAVSGTSASVSVYLGA
jgi:hypothetical protein